MDHDRVKNLVTILADIKSQFAAALSEFNSLKGQSKNGEVDPSEGRSAECRSDINKLGEELIQLGNHLSEVTPHHHLSFDESVCHQSELTRLSLDCEHLKTRCNTAVSEAQCEREERLCLEREVLTKSEAMAQQTDYCSRMGAACSTLLWRATQREEGVYSVLAGSKVGEFLAVVRETVESYVNTYSDGPPGHDTDENHFILALCGTVANLAAWPAGREFLMTSGQGRQVVDTFLDVLSIRPDHLGTQLISLIVVTLFNVSINEKGINYLTGRSDIPEIIGSILKGCTGECRLQSVRLIQSLIYDRRHPELLSGLQHILTADVLEALKSDDSADVRKATLDMMADLQRAGTEQ